ncbi:MAG: peptidoglycan DD-metalloendopeptidase family protein [Alphaproteobacteria bacterium]
MKRFRPDRISLNAAALLIAAALTSAAGADELRSRLDALQRDIDRTLSDKATLEKTAEKTEEEIRALKLAAVRLATQLHDRSEAVDRIEARLATLVEQEAEKSRRFIRRRAELSATLGALQRIARLPTATLIAMPRPPDDTIRSAILLRAAVPELHREASALSDELRELARLQHKIGDDRTRLDEALAGLDRERARLASLTARKMELLKSARTGEREAARQVASLSSQAVSLRGLVERLEASRKEDTARGEEIASAPPTTARRALQMQSPAQPSSPSPTAAIPLEELPPGVSSAPSSLPAPGRIVRRFGDKLDNGLQSRGVSIATRPSATIVAPHPGRVVYAGEFRGYGNLVILELSDRRHALIAGLGRIDAEIGDQVLAGEPLGQMSPSTNDAPNLYFEVRRRGQPINPLPSSAALKTR